MGKFLNLLLILSIFTALPTFAEDTAQTVNDNKAVIALQKQPSNEAQKQKATNNRWCIIIQINGKVKDTNNLESAR